jgi:hypothetical protein
VWGLKALFRRFRVKGSGFRAQGLGFEGSVSQVHSAVSNRQNEIEIGQIAELGSQVHTHTHKRAHTLTPSRISDLGAQEAGIEEDAPDYQG